MATLCVSATLATRWSTKCSAKNLRRRDKSRPVHPPVRMAVWDTTARMLSPWYTAGLGQQSVFQTRPKNCRRRVTANERFERNKEEKRRKRRIRPRALRADTWISFRRRTDHDDKLQLHYRSSPRAPATIHFRFSIYQNKNFIFSPLLLYPGSQQGIAPFDNWHNFRLVSIVFQLFGNVNTTLRVKSSAWEETLLAGHWVATWKLIKVTIHPRRPRGRWWGGREIEVSPPAPRSTPGSPRMGEHQERHQKWDTTDVSSVGSFSA